MKLNRITSNPNKMNGQACIRDLRLTVRRVVDLLATYPDREELFHEFPELEEEDIQQVLIFASSYHTKSDFQSTLLKPPKSTKNGGL